MIISKHLPLVFLSVGWRIFSVIDKNYISTSDYYIRADSIFSCFHWNCWYVMIKSVVVNYELTLRVNISRRIMIALPRRWMQSRNGLLITKWLLVKQKSWFLGLGLRLHSLVYYRVLNCLIISRYRFRFLSIAYRSNHYHLFVSLNRR